MKEKGKICTAVFEINTKTTGPKPRSQPYQHKCQDQTKTKTKPEQGQQIKSSTRTNTQHEGGKTKTQTKTIRQRARPRPNTKSTTNRNHQQTNKTEIKSNTRNQFISDKNPENTRRWQTQKRNKRDLKLRISKRKRKVIAHTKNTKSERGRWVEGKGTLTLNLNPNP